MPTGVLVVLALAGCYDMHGTSTDLGTSPHLDGGTEPFGDVPATPDAHLFPDVTLPDLDAGSCTMRDVDVACALTGNAAIPVGVPFDLPVYLSAFDGCYCGERIECSATVTGDVIDLTTRSCDESLCEACFPSIEGACSLPPLAEGVYRVRINGNDAFDFPVSSVSPLIPVDACVATPGPRGCMPLFPSVDTRIDLACISERSGGGPIAVQVTNPCAGCGATPGPCQVIVNGTDVSLYTHELPSGCDVACPDVCRREESTCFIPPLEDGTYTLRVEGLPPTTFEVLGGSPTTRTCAGLGE